MKSRQDVSKEHLNNGLNEKKNQSREDLGKGSSGRELAGSDGKASAYNVGDLGSIPGSGRFPWRRKWQPTPIFLPGKSHGQRKLAGYSPWGRKESDTAERLYFTLRRSN